MMRFRNTESIAGKHDRSGQIRRCVRAISQLRFLRHRGRRSISYSDQRQTGLGAFREIFVN